ncbi:LacI family DNA-binding transcriptional regulator [Enterocloster clostridioformis]|uniref:Transcriptional regulator n=1 Tax=Enterocloster clostridioformis TaxID=1531 RepID=A0A2X2WNC7_9FIRM|nr:transcriptional regulator [Enterocloster clostridioformis]
MNAPTIKDVANAAGVSVATISRVLSNPDLVKPATKEHVLQIIKEMNYQPNVSCTSASDSDNKSCHCYCS